jgi:hypothetical protein
VSNHYVMFGDYRISCSEEYMNAFGLVDGQSIDHVTVDGMNKLADAASDMRIIDIGNGINRLRETRAELLAAAKAIYQAVHGDTVAVGPLWGRLHAAIAAVEEP